MLAPSPHDRIRWATCCSCRARRRRSCACARSSGCTCATRSMVGEKQLTSVDVQLVEAVIPAGSVLVGRTLAESDFRALYNLNVLAIAKHGTVQPLEVASTRLEVGDTLLDPGAHEATSSARTGTTQDHRALRASRRSPSGRGGRADAGLARRRAALADADCRCTPRWPRCSARSAWSALRCLRPVDALRAQDFPVLLLLGGMLALGSAFEKHGLGVERRRLAGRGAGAPRHPFVPSAACWSRRRC